MDKYIEEELTTFYGKTFSRSEDTKDWLRKSYTRVVKKALDEQKKDLIKNANPEIQEILWDYSDWLHKQGYIDTDYYSEDPKAVDEYLKNK